MGEDGERDLRSAPVGDRGRGGGMLRIFQNLSECFRILQNFLEFVGTFQNFLEFLGTFQSF